MIPGPRPPTSAVACHGRPQGLLGLLNLCRWSHGLGLLNERVPNSSQVVSEIRLKVKLPVPDDVPPAILTPHPILPPPPLVFSQTTTNHTLLVRDEDTIMAVEVHVLSNLPEGAELSHFKIRGDKTGV